MSHQPLAALFLSTDKIRPPSLPSSSRLSPDKTKLKPSDMARREEGQTAGGSREALAGQRIVSYHSLTAVV